MPAPARKRTIIRQPRRRPLTVRLSVEECAALERKAIDAGLRPAEVARVLIREGKVRAATPALNVQAWSKLGSLQSQLEQLLADGPFREVDRILIGSLSKEVSTLRLALLGYDRKNK